MINKRYSVIHGVQSKSKETKSNTLIYEEAICVETRACNEVPILLKNLYK